jgi:squalene-hopene/tetraprenyl-beta-curcumene cyclase
MARFYSLLALFCAFSLTAAPPSATEYALDGQVVALANDGIRRGTDWLINAQNPNGSWGAFSHPAITALCVMALHESTCTDPDAREAAIDKGLARVLTFVQHDGSIYPAGGDPKQSAYYPNYTTSIALLVLATVNRAEDRAVMKAARAYLRSSQFSDEGKADFGGIGYGKTGRADLSNASWAAEALYFTDYLEREPFAPSAAEVRGVQQMWGNLQTFLGKCQNHEGNSETFVSDHPDDYGGFVYRPYESKAGERGAEGKHSGLISSGSMTYAGLKSMIYAGLDRRDPRVKGAILYLRKNYVLHENPSMGMQGLYYYLHTMVKALDVYGEDIFIDANGYQHDWRTEIVEELLGLQHHSGKWENIHGRYLESVPELAGAYALITMKTAMGTPNLDRRAR